MEEDEIAPLYALNFSRGVFLKMEVLCKMTNVETGGVRRGRLSARKLSMIGMLAAVSTVLAFIDFSLPFFPPFLKFDLSDLPVDVYKRQGQGTRTGGEHRGAAPPDL